MRKLLTLLLGVLIVGGVSAQFNFSTNARIGQILNAVNPADTDTFTVHFNTDLESASWTYNAETEAYTVVNRKVQTQRGMQIRVYDNPTATDNGIVNSDFECRDYGANRNPQHVQSLDSLLSVLNIFDIQGSTANSKSKPAHCLFDIDGDPTNQGFGAYPANLKRVEYGFRYNFAGKIVVDDISLEVATYALGNTGKTASYKLEVYQGSVSEANKMGEVEGIYVTGSPKATIKVAEAIGKLPGDFTNKAIFFFLKTWGTTNAEGVLDALPNAVDKMDPIIIIDNLRVAYNNPVWVHPAGAILNAVFNHNNGNPEFMGVQSTDRTGGTPVPTVANSLSPIRFRLTSNDRVAALTITEANDGGAHAPAFSFANTGAIKRKDANGNYTEAVEYTQTINSTSGVFTLTIPAPTSGPVSDTLEITMLANVPKDATRALRLEITNGVRIWYNISAIGSLDQITVGQTGVYPTLADAISGINSLGGISATSTLELTPDYAPVSDVISAVTGASANNKLVIRPQAPLTVSGNASFVWKIDGASHINIDGRVNGEGPAALTIIADTLVGNSLTESLKHTIALQFVNDATHNTVQYVNFKGATSEMPWRSGSSTMIPTKGTITFGAGITTGNSNNSILNCDLGPVHPYTGTPTVAIYSLGTEGAPNANINIANNNIYDFYSTDLNKNTTGGSGAGILFLGNTTNSTISGNSFYQTEKRLIFGNANGARTGGIFIANPTGKGFVVKDNYIGGSQPMAEGEAYFDSIRNNMAFNGVYMNVAQDEPSYIYGNQIKNLVIYSHSPWAQGYQTAAIHAQGNVIVGIKEDESAAGNVIGDLSPSAVGDNASIQFWGSNNNATFTGILLFNGTAGTSEITVANNTIAGIRGNLTAVQSYFLTPIHILGTTGTLNAVIENNLIGNDGVGVAPAQMSIQNSSRSIYGIYMQNGNVASTTSIKNNRINNLYGMTASNFQTHAFGVWINNNVEGAVTVDGNTMNDFVYTNNRIDDTSSVYASGAGIMFAGRNANGIVSNNTIFNIHGMDVGSQNVAGISVQNTAAGKVKVFNNLIYNISSNVVAPVKATVTGVTGINTSTTGALAPEYTVYNNMIRLGWDRNGAAITDGISISGIRDSVATTGAAIANYYHNTILIGGAGVSDVNAQPTFGMSFSAGSSAQRNVINNLIVNERANAAAGAGHYAIGTAGSSAALTNFVTDYNAYKAAAMGRFADGAVAASLADLKTATGNDAGSIVGNPYFVDAYAAVPDLHLTRQLINNNLLVGIALTAVTTDFDGDPRSEVTPVTIGADEFVGPGTQVDPIIQNGLFTSVEGNVVTIHGTRSGDTIQVFNIGGQKVMTAAANDETTLLTLNSGIYVLQVESVTNNARIKIIVR